MLRKPEQRDAARRLRASGLALSHIAAQVGASKSTVSLWVRDVPVPLTAPYWQTGGRLERFPRPVDAQPAVRLPVWRSGRTKRCSRCHLLPPVESFNRLAGGRQWYCRACFREYHRRNADDHRRKGKLAAAARQRRARERVLAVLRERQCTDCGEADAVLLEFDHLSTKRHHLSDLVSAGRSLGSIDAELEGCEVVCVNCHRRRTANRAGWRRREADWQSRLELLTPAVARNVRLTYGRLEANGCADCGIEELTLLDFDHIGPKRFAVMSGAWQGFTIAELEHEMAACVVRCANCHRRRTAREAGYYRWIDGRGGSDSSLDFPRPP